MTARRDRWQAMLSHLAGTEAAPATDTAPTGRVHAASPERREAQAAERKRLEQSTADRSTWSWATRRAHERRP
jgi:hypothetical protein